jgi:hypothetical protein
LQKVFNAQGSEAQPDKASGPKGLE